MHLNLWDLLSSTGCQITLMGYGIWDMEQGRKIIGFAPEDNAGTQWALSKDRSSVMKSGDPQE